jgi:hypothetical protein
VGSLGFVSQSKLRCRKFTRRRPGASLRRGLYRHAHSTLNIATRPEGSSRTSVATANAFRSGWMCCGTGPTLGGFSAVASATALKTSAGSRRTGTSRIAVRRPASGTVRRRRDSSVSRPRLGGNCLTDDGTGDPHLPSCPLVAIGVNPMSPQVCVLLATRYQPRQHP